MEIRAPAETVFAYIDDIRNLGWHMTTQSSMALMGSRLTLERLSPSASRLTISIVYELPRSGFWRIVGLVLARSYSRWCLRRMCRDTKRVLEAALTVRA